MDDLTGFIEGSPDKTIKEILRIFSESTINEHNKVSGEDVLKQIRADFFSQEHIVKWVDNIFVSIVKKAEVFSDIPNLIFIGKSGSGKSYLAGLLSKYVEAEKGIQCRTVSYTYASNIPNMTGFYNIEEIHAVTNHKMESIYPNIDNKDLRIWGSTTQPAKLDDALRRRCNYIYINDYKPDDIIKVYSKKYKCLSAPRIKDTIKLLLTIQNTPGKIQPVLNNLEVLCSNGELTSSKDVEMALQICGYNRHGLSLHAIDLLKVLYDYKKPVGIQALSAMCSSYKEMISDAEKELLALGLIDLSGKGRCITETGIRYLEKEAKNGSNKGGSSK